MAVRVRGAKEAARSLERLAAEAEHLDAIETAGEVAQYRLRDLSPRLTGRLAESWHVVRQGEHVRAVSDLAYAAVQDRGGYHGITGHHYSDAAAAVVEQQIERLVVDELDGLIARM